MFEGRQIFHYWQESHDCSKIKFSRMFSLSRSVWLGKTHVCPFCFEIVLPMPIFSLPGDPSGGGGWRSWRRSTNATAEDVSDVVPLHVPGTEWTVCRPLDAVTHAGVSSMTFGLLGWTGPKPDVFETGSLLKDRWVQSVDFGRCCRRPCSNSAEHGKILFNDYCNEESVLALASQV